MISKFHTYKYQWNSLSVIVDCTKCGNNIVLQKFDGNPECSDCGNVNKLSWDHIIKEIDILGMKKGGSDHKVMMGSINGKVQMDPINGISCYHCKKTLELPAQEELNNYSCNHCKNPIHFKEYNGLDELVFYRAAFNDTSSNKVQMIAVRCVSCGAPLEADPTKNNFHCKFCSTDNILPPSLRYKVVLDDVFVALRNSKYLKLMAFEQDGQIVKQALRENGRESFADAELDQVLLNKKDDVSVYNTITHNLKYLPSDKILTQLFNTSINYEVIKMVGTRLQKTNEEIEERISQFTPKFKENKKSFEKAQHKQQVRKRTRSIFSVQNMIYFIIGIALVIVLIVVWNSLN